MIKQDDCKACDADLMKFLTDDERAVATADNAALWRPLAKLRKRATIVDGAERLDRHGFSLAVDSEARGGMTSTVKHRTHPCANCPYRKDAPLGLWHEDHYFDVIESEGSPLGIVFQCHKDGEKPRKERSMCAGYLLDQKKRGLPSVALRAKVSCDELALKAFKRVRSTVEMFESATKMAIANLKKILADAKNRPTRDV